MYVYICTYVNIQAYLFGLSQPLTTPVEAPPLPGQEPEKIAFGTFRAPAPEGGGFHGRSQSLIEPKKYVDVLGLFLKMRETKSHKKRFVLVAKWRLFGPFKFPQDGPLGSRMAFSTL